MSALPTLYYFEACEPIPDRRQSGSRGITLWLYTPGMKTIAASRFVLDMEDLTLASTLPNPDIGLWVMSSGKPMLRQLSWRGWRTRPWLKHLFGTICDPLTAAHGAGAFISSLPDIHASRSARQEIAGAQPIPDIFGQRSPGLSEKPIQNGCSAKMSKAISIWDSPTSSATFKAWATALKRDCSRREKQAQAIGVAASSSWPTPTASDAGYFPELLIANGSIQPVSPQDIAAGSCGQFALNNASRVWTHFFQMMGALGVSLSTISPYSRQVRVSFKHGATSSLTALISNPRFYELTMGWPIGWSAPEESVTGFAAWLQRSRGELLNRLSEAA